MSSPATARRSTTRSGGRRHSADKRRSILDAAAPLFGDLGYERAGIDAIAAAAGVSKPTIYSYFGSKEDLFRASVADSATNLNADTLEAVRTFDVRATDWRSALVDLGMALSACARSECAASLSRLVNAEVMRDPSVYTMVRQAGYEPIMDALAGRLAMLANRGVITTDDPELAAKQLMALIQAEVPDLTALGTAEVSEHEVRRAVIGGIETFVRAFATDV